MIGTLIYRSKSYPFDCVNDLPLQAVKAYVEQNPISTKDDVMLAFKDGLKGGAKHFIVETKNYPGRSYIKRETIILKDAFGNDEPCYVSSEFSNSGDKANLPFFVDHIKTMGFTVRGYSYPSSMLSGSKVGGYNIIDVDKYPILQELRKNLYSKNSQAFDLMDKLDTSGLLKSEGFDNWGMMINDVLKTPEYILFSSDTQTTKYGKFNRFDLIKSAAELASKVLDSSLDESVKAIILEILEGIIRGRENNNCNLNEVINEIKDILKDVDKKEYEDIFDGIAKLGDTAMNLQFEVPLYGVYLSEETKIVLFLNNILNKPAGNELFDRRELYDSYPIINKDVERTYIHELFHMIHLGMEFIVSNDDYGDTVVIEGLARYFEIMYSEKYLGTVAKAELDSLMRHYSVVSYPYTGACYIDRFDEHRFGEIVDKSAMPDCHVALHCLLEGTIELETIIKNL